MTLAPRRPPRQGQDTRFQSLYTEHELLDVVRVVSLHARPAEAAACTQAQFDDGRAGAGRADAPRARAIAQRLGISWPYLLEVIHDPKRDPWRTITALRSDMLLKHFTLDDGLEALRHVGGYLGRRTIDRTQYEQTREAIVAADRRAYRHGGRGQRTLPSLVQVEQIFRRNDLVWEQGLKQAGLNPPRPQRSKALTPLAAVRAFVKDTGYAPTSMARLRKWGQASGQAVRGHAAPEMRAAIAKINEQRAKSGKPPLKRAPGSLTFADVQTSTNVTSRKFIRGRTRDDYIEGLVLAMDYLEPGENLSQRALKRIARENPALGIPSYSTVNEGASKLGETFVQWRAEAIERRRSARSRQ